MITYIPPEEISDKDYILADTPELQKYSTHYTIESNLNSDTEESMVRYYIRRDILNRQGKVRLQVVED